MSFEERNSPKENCSLCKQLTLSYNILRKERAPVSLYLASLGNSCSDILRAQGVDKWAVTKADISIDELFPRGDIVYLSPDAPEILADISRSKVRERIGV